MGAIFGMFVFIVIGLIWLVPLVMIAQSNRTNGGEKAAWILAMIFVSWFAWVFYMLLAPLKERSN